MVGGFGFEDADLDSWVPGPEAADQAGHRVDRERREGGDLERSCAQFDHAGDRVVGLVDCSLDLSGRADQRLAGGREP